MTESIQQFFNTSDFMPHGMCIEWRSDLLFLHIISDTIIAISYFSIPFALFYFVKRRQDLEYQWMFIMFGIFILACGSTHVMNIWNMWNPDYAQSGLLKAGTATASVATAILLWPVVPKLLALPSPTMLALTNTQLRDEISERKKIEEGLRIRDRAIAASDNGILIVDALQNDLPIIYCNPMFEKITGYGTKEVVGRDCRSLLSNGGNEAELRKIRLGLRKERRARAVLRSSRKDGSLFWNELFVSPVKDEKGQTTHYIGIQNDISERMDAEKQLTQMSKVFMDSADPIVIEDFSGKIIDLNDEAVRTYGWTRKELLGGPTEKLIPKESRQQAAERVEHCKQGAMIRNSEGLGHTKSGEVFPVLLTLSLLTDEAGEPAAIATLAKNISQLKETEKQLRESHELLEQRVEERTAELAATNSKLRQQIVVCERTEQAFRIAKEEAENANLSKSNFLAAASHDLRQPLQSLDNYVAIMARTAVNDQNRKVVGQLRDSLSAMGGLLNALLDVSRLESGMVKAEFRDFRVDDVLNRVRANVASQAEAKGLKFRIVPSNYCIRSDISLLQRVIENFAFNAVRYTQQGGVLIGCPRRGQYLRIEIWDTGIGIAQEEIEQLFEEYVQLNNPARDRSKGLGLGLAVVKHTARLLEHHIDVRSIPGKGSVFSIEAPIAETLSPSVDAEKDEPLARGHADASILLIDDDPDVLDSTQELLEFENFVVIPASSGAEAMAKLHVEDLHPDVVLSDYRLPGGETGVELIQRIRAHLGDDVPAIILTGDTSMEQLVDTQAFNCQVLHKPFESTRLASCINQLLRENA